MENETVFYPDSRTYRRISWLAGYAFLAVWWFALREKAPFPLGVLFCLSGVLLLISGVFTPLFRARPLLVAHPAGVRIYEAHMGGGTDVEIPRSNLKSVTVGRRYIPGVSRRDRPGSPVLALELTDDHPDLKDAGYFRWNSKTKELYLLSPPKGGFNRVMNTIHRMHLNLDIPLIPEETGIKTTFAAAFDVLLFSVVVLTGVPAATGNIHVVENLFHLAVPPTQSETSQSTPSQPKATYEFKKDLYLQYKSLMDEGLEKVRKNRNDEAEFIYRKGLEKLMEAYGPTHPAVPGTLWHIGKTLYHQKKLGEAEEFYLQSLKILEERGRPDDLSFALNYEGLSEICEEQGKYVEAEELIRKAMPPWQKLRGEENMNVVQLLHSQARLLEKMNRSAEAEQVKAKAQEMTKKLRSADTKPKPQM